MERGTDHGAAALGRGSRQKRCGSSFRQWPRSGGSGALLVRQWVGFRDPWMEFRGDRSARLTDGRTPLPLWRTGTLTRRPCHHQPRHSVQAANRAGAGTRPVLLEAMAAGGLVQRRQVLAGPALCHLGRLHVGLSLAGGSLAARPSRSPSPPDCSSGTSTRPSRLPIAPSPRFSNIAKPRPKKSAPRDGET